MIYLFAGLFIIFIILCPVILAYSLLIEANMKNYFHVETGEDGHKHFVKNDNLKLE